MTAAEWAVVVGGALSIAWINWYFFLAGKSTTKVIAERRDERQG